MTKLEKMGLILTILSILVHQATYSPEIEIIARTLSAIVFLIGWTLFIVGGKNHESP